MKNLILIAVVLLLASCQSNSSSAKVEGFLNWRGPNQNGTSLETGLPDTWDVQNGTAWKHEIKGRGAPVIAGNRVFSLGYVGDKQELREVLSCIDLQTGKILWQNYYSDFMSDIIYDRYSIGSPTIDPETGLLYVMTTPGLLICLNQDGKELWKISLMEKFGKMTFPNGRTGAPVIFGDTVVIHGISANWGKQGPPRSRFYAYRKDDGTPVWNSTPGVGPKDSSFSTPVISDFKGRKVMYATTGCGNLVCFDASTGTPYWRYQMCIGGANCSVLVYKDTIIAVHGKENLDTSTTGRMIAIKMPKELKPGQVLDKSSELWRSKIDAFSSSPVLVEDKVYMVDETGNLHCLNADSGKTLWTKKLGSAQIHASPLYAEGKLYIPLLIDSTDEKSNSGLFYIIKPTETGAEILSKVRIHGKCLGSPAIYNGKVLVHTTSTLYCFGNESGKTSNFLAPELATDNKAPAGAKVVTRQILPNEVLLKPGEAATFKCRELDAQGRVIRVGDLPAGKWAGYIPPTAKVKASMNGKFNDNGVLTADPKVQSSAGAYRFSANDGIKSVIRGRVLPSNYEEDFESFTPTVPRPAENTKYAWPPLAWIGARFKWEIREIDGNKCLIKVQDRLILQRAISFIGDPDMEDYTIQADVMTGGNRRVMSDVGLINQRYIIALKGTHRSLSISSNLDRLEVNKRFPVKANTWYTLKTKVKKHGDGSGTIFVKCWKKDTDEPAEWTLEHKTEHVHDKGAPGLFGFSPGGLKPVFVDNIKVSANEGK
ncbi:MAG: PQQ-binding-like beta-propeller repeat protein [Lentisphaeraceae bacterium]|nr:PQQ-binding-like beta-propeller repeat protein [Lentisphaeraceae bacterium]